jgi:hypothetical protein
MFRKQNKTNAERKKKTLQEETEEVTSNSQNPTAILHSMQQDA